MLFKKIRMHKIPLASIREEQVLRALKLQITNMETSMGGQEITFSSADTGLLLSIFNNLKKEEAGRLFVQF